MLLLTLCVIKFREERLFCFADQLQLIVGSALSMDCPFGIVKTTIVRLVRNLIAEYGFWRSESVLYIGHSSIFEKLLIHRASGSSWQC